MTAASPGIVASAMLNEHYAVVRGVRRRPSPTRSRPSTQAIVAARLRAADRRPDLAMERHTSYADRPLADFLRFVDTNVTALNRALADDARGARPPARLLGQLRGPARRRRAARRDPAAALRAPASARSCSRWPIRATPTSTAASRRHPLPAEMLLDRRGRSTRRPTTSSIPRSSPTGSRSRRRPSAIRAACWPGTDCGFATSAGLGEVAEEVVWLKLRALADGAALATTDSCADRVRLERSTPCRTPKAV